MSFVATSCSSDSDEENETNNTSIIGDWQSVSSQGYDIVIKSKERTDNKERPYDHLYMNFNEDGTCMIGDPKIANNGQLCRYTIQGKELILEANGEKDKFIIEELSTDKLVVSYTYYGYNKKGEDIEIHVIYTMIRVNKYLGHNGGGTFVT